MIASINIYIPLTIKFRLIKTRDYAFNIKTRDYAFIIKTRDYVIIKTRDYAFYQFQLCAHSF